jgi:hypothetical protein
MVPTIMVLNVASATASQLMWRSKMLPSGGVGPRLSAWMTQGRTEIDSVPRNFLAMRPMDSVDG